MTDVERFLRGLHREPIEGAYPYFRALAGDSRLPADTLAAARVPSDVRLELAAAAGVVEIDYTARTPAGGLPRPLATSFTAWRGERRVAEAPAVAGGGTAVLDLRAGAEGAGERVVVHLPEDMAPVVLDVRGQGEPVEPATQLPRVACYGDSITQGWSASEPGRRWTSLVARRAGVDVVNLGYAGAARGEIPSAEWIGELGASAVVISYGTNCWTRVAHTPEMIATGLEGFIGVVRAAQPEVPVVVVGPIARPDAEDVPNVLGATLAELRSAMEGAVERAAGSDPALVLLAGATLVDPAHLLDGVHPGDGGHEQLAAAVARVVSSLLGGVATRS